MQKTMSDLRKGIISEEKPQQCDDCGKVAELRPYGPGGSCICVDCAYKDPETTKIVTQAMNRLISDYLEDEEPGV